MTRILPKDRISLFAVVATAMLVFASSAASQECAVDADCGDGEYCQPDPHFEMCLDPEPDQEWACEENMVLPENNGRCLLIAERCETDDDCAEYFACRKEKSGMAEGCAAPAEPGSDVPECSSRSIEFESQYGNCEPGPIDCNTDSDCPSPLTCVDFGSPGGCWASSDGGSFCEEGTIDKRCEFEPSSCETDDDCEVGSECVEAGSSMDCAAGIGTAGSEPETPLPDDPGAPEDVPIMPSCDEDDEACTSGSGGSSGDVPPGVEPEPMPIMPDCEADIEKICFPKRVDCVSDAGCAAGETCTDFSEMRSSPPWWEDGDQAIVCMPEGLAMALQGHASRGVADTFAGGAETISPDSALSSTNKTDVVGGGDPDEGGEEVDGEGETIGTGSENESEASGDGGCSIARSSGNASSSWLLLLASVLVLRSIRRRRS